MSTSPASPTNTALIFTCPNHDFIIKTLPDGFHFQVERNKLVAGSGVFRDMFDVIPDHNSPRRMEKLKEEILEVHEPSDLFLLFVKLLHGELGALETSEPTEPLQTVLEASPSSDIASISNISNESAWSLSTPTVSPPSTVASPAAVRPTEPHPIIPPKFLRTMMSLLDKYDVPMSPHQEIVMSHFRLNAEKYPLDIYCLAHQLDLIPIAAHASQYLLDRPIEFYSMETVIEYFPSVKAYHRLTLLHAHRKWKLREVLKGEEIFPHDYGYCTAHGQATRTRWDALKKHLEPLITGATDVPAEMAVMRGSVQTCYKCNRACIMAVDMLKASLYSYKVDKVPKTFDCVPGTM
ncbi:hypothetical protein FRB96_004174 [Tulasnella sp. 330]|nr:hypothetical protein FRB96_004174 [Tulasnella sp. 330]